MARSAKRVSAGLCMVLTLAGCSPLTHSSLRAVSGGVPKRRPEALPACPRGELTADLAGPSLPVAAQETFGRPKGVPPYRAWACWSVSVGRCRLLTGRT